MLFTYFVILVSCLLIALRSEPFWSTIVHRYISHVVFICFCEHWYGHRFVACSWSPLPFSYGGTAMLTVFIGLGLVVNVAIHQHVQDNDLL